MRGIPSSNPAEGTDIRLLVLVVYFVGSALYDGLIPRPE
jgi:hypothetical protein